MIEYQLAGLVYGHPSDAPALTGDQEGTARMALSARNQITGTVTSVRTDGLMAEVVVDIGATAPIVSVITRTSAESLGLREGSSVTVVVKSTEVMLATND